MKSLKPVSYAVLIAAALSLAACDRASPGGDIPFRPLSDLFVDEDNAFETGMIQTGISDILSKVGEGEYTLFLPGSDAFIRVLEEAGLTEEEFLRLGNLEEILSYDVAIGTYDVFDYKAGAKIKTLAGQTLQLQATDTEHASVNDVRLTSVLNDTTLNSNGEYEVVDGLLLPPGVSLP